MNSTLHAALGALVHALAPGTGVVGDRATSATATGPTDRTFAEQQYVAPTWEHGHVPMSVDLFGALAQVLDARTPAIFPDTPETPSAEQSSRLGPIHDDCSALSGEGGPQDSG